MLPQIDRVESDEENVCMIKNECVEGTESEEERGTVDVVQDGDSEGRGESKQG